MGCASSSQAVSASNPPAPIRTGSDGLADLGFEYRMVPCDLHPDRVDSCYTSDHVCFDCATRLFRITDNVLITPENRKSYIHGHVYDQVRKASYKIVRHWLERDCEMERLDLYHLANEDEPVQALVTRSAQLATTTATLLIITGRGTCRAGVLSTRYIIEAGLEKGSALFHIIRAIQRNMSVVCLDPNARGSVQGLDTVKQSLASEHLAPYLQDRPLYILAHSAAGGYLVQYLLEQPKSPPSSLQQPEQPRDTKNSSKNETTSNALRKPLVTIPQIRGLVFTDSTHNLQWLSLRARPDVVDFLQSNHCLYVRNNREHPSDTFGHAHRSKAAGEPFEQKNDHWIQRFGSIPAVYAGTPDHSMMCFQARNVIWDFFDKRRKLAV